MKNPLTRQDVIKDKVRQQRTIFVLSIIFFAITIASLTSYIVFPLFFGTLPGDTLTIGKLFGTGAAVAGPSAVAFRLLARSQQQQDAVIKLLPEEPSVVCGADEQSASREDGA